jgi:hypothetical protein
MPSMPNLSQTLKGHNSGTVHPFELKFLVEMHFGQLYLGFTRQVLGIDQSIAIDTLSTPETIKSPRRLDYKIDDYEEKKFSKAGPYDWPL